MTKRFTKAAICKTSNHQPSVEDSIQHIILKDKQSLSIENSIVLVNKMLKLWLQLFKFLAISREHFIPRNPNINQSIYTHSNDVLRYNCFLQDEASKINTITKLFLLTSTKVDKQDTSQQKICSWSNLNTGKSKSTTLGQFHKTKMHQWTVSRILIHWIELKSKHYTHHSCSIAYNSRYPIPNYPNWNRINIQMISVK